MAIKRKRSKTTEKRKTIPKYNQDAVIRGALRRAFARSPIARSKLFESRKETPKFKKDGSLAKKMAVTRQCQVCQRWVSTTKINVDHIEPVVCTQAGFTDWNEFISRLWCPISNLQRICLDCHKEKTMKERENRIKNLELIQLLQCENCNNLQQNADCVKFLKKFTDKRFQQFKYDDNFKQRIQYQQKRLPKSVKKKQQNTD